MGSRIQKMASSSYLGELDVLIWACGRTKALRGANPAVVRTDNHALVERWQSPSLYDSDVRIFRQWSWLVAHEPELTIEFMPGSENTGAELLSKLIDGRGQEDSTRPIPVVQQV